MNNQRFARLGRGGCVLFALTLTGQAASGGVAPSAYFSLEGDIPAAGDQYDFTFDLTRPVGSGEDLRFVTYSNSGGVNEAGDTIAQTFMDANLQLFDSLNALRGQDDESGPGFDALLSWPGITQPSETPLNPDPLPTDSYRLNIKEFNPATFGQPWSLDLIGPSDALVFTGGSPVNTGTVNSLKFGSNSGGTAVYDHSAASGTFTLLGDMVVAQTGNADLNLSGGTITAGGLTTVNAGGTVSQTAGTFNANGGLLIDGGSYTDNSGGFSLGSGQTLTIQNGGTFERTTCCLDNLPATGTVNVSGNGSTLNHLGLPTDDRTLVINGTTVNATAGGDILANHLFLNDGSMTIDGAGSLLDVSAGNSAGFIHRIGSGSGTATLTLSNNATGTFANPTDTTLFVGQTGSTATVDVLSGADLTLLNLDMDETGTSTVTVDGSGSTITQTAGSALTVGSASGSTGTLNVQNSGVFNASNTGTLNINATGSLNADSGTFNANGSGSQAGGMVSTFGDINLTGSGRINLDGGSPDISGSAIAGVGGGLNVNAGTVDLSGTSDILMRGGRPGEGQVGAAGGTLSINGGAINASGDSRIAVNGGRGGNAAFFPDFGPPGGSGGTATVTGGTLTLAQNATLQLHGGFGGGLFGGDTMGSDGGVGGTLNVNGGSVIVNDNATVSLRGGEGWALNFSSFTNGDGGDAGNVNLSSGSMFVNGGLVTLQGGAPAMRPLAAPGSYGANGQFNVTGGTFEMNGGEVFTGTFQRSGAGIFNHNDGLLTVAGGTFDTGTANHTINGPSGVELPTLVLTDGATAPGVTGDFIVGDDNRGRFELLNGSTLSSAEVRLGTLSGGNGEALVDGAGSAWTSSGANAFVIGEDGTGELTVTNGGAVSTSDYFVVGRGSTSNGTVHIGSGGAVDATSPGNELVIAEIGTAVVNIGSNGTMSSANHLNIAWFASADGTLNVDGVDATVTAHKSLNVGGGDTTSGGAGKLTVSNDALVRLNGGNLRNYAGGTIDLSVDGRIDATPAPAGLGVDGSNGRTLTTSGVITNTDGSILFDGGDGGGNAGLFVTAGTGGVGGTLNATGGSITNLGDGVLSFNGGDGGTTGCCDNFGGDGGAGGTINLTNTTVTLNSGLFLANGGNGGGGEFFDDGVGGAGGTINLNSGSVTQNGMSSVLLTGGDAGSGPLTPGTVGGDGGTLNILSGTYSLNDTATLDLRGGQGTKGNADGAHGMIVVQSGNFTMNGGEVFAGTIDHPGTGAFDLFGGTLHVENFNGTLDQQGGTLAPGFSAGKTVISNDYGLAVGTLEIELGGLAQGVEYDYVEVLGFASLFGDLDVSFIDGFVPTYGDSFQFLMAWGGVTDNFSIVNLPAVPVPDAVWNLINDGNTLTLSLDSTLVGDLNNDGFVGIDDLNLVLGNWNQTIPPGDPLADPSGDNFVGIADLNLVLGNWNAGTPPPPGVNASIPEPGTGVLLALGTLVLGRRGARGR